MKNMARITLSTMLIAVVVFNSSDGKTSEANEAAHNDNKEILSGANPKSEEKGDAYLNAVLDKIKSKIVEPESAAKNMVGPYAIAFRLSSSGNLRSIAVIQSSGWVDYDAAVMEAIKNSAPFPLFPEDIPDLYMDLILQAPGRK